MKISRTLLSLFLLVILHGCIQSEEPNAEADILSCNLLETDLVKSINLDNNSVGNLNIGINLKKETDLSVKLTPIFEITPGATISPASGEPQDFSLPVVYTVTSEDRKWINKYTVTAFIADIPTQFNFENVITNSSITSKFFSFVEYSDEKKEILRWASGNSGYSIIGGRDPYDYPTTQSSNGVNGAKCAKLVTKSTGGFGALVGMPLAAGNLFLGEFDSSIATIDPLKATQFGEILDFKPVAIKGWYMYTPQKYIIKDPITNKKVEIEDKADIYAVIYENSIRLNGANILNDESIIAIAQPREIKKTNIWKQFKYDFLYREGKQIDLAKLANGQYKLAIVFTSSKDGAQFKGAIGSELYIDEVEILTTENN